MLYHVQIDTTPVYTCMMARYLKPTEYEVEMNALLQRIAKQALAACNVLCIAPIMYILNVLILCIMYMLDVV
jgi:hypothetical protein